MSLTEGLLVAIVIILTIYLLTRSRGKEMSSGSRTWDCVDRSNGEITSVKMQYKGEHGLGCKCPKCNNPEKKTTAEHMEYFDAGQGGGAAAPDVNSCTDDNFAYAQNDFGGPGMDFKDWATSQAVDTAVLVNHANFVKDRLGDNTQNGTRGSMALGEIEGSYQVPWIGIRGPAQHVPVYNPTQVPDVDPSLFTDKPRFNWDSSPSSTVRAEPNAYLHNDQ